MDADARAIQGGDGMKIIIVLKNGFTLTVTCDEFSLNKNGLEQYTGYEIKGIEDNKPIFIRWEDVSLIYRADINEVTEWMEGREDTE